MWAMTGYWDGTELSSRVFAESLKAQGASTWWAGLSWFLRNSRRGGECRGALLTCRIVPNHKEEGSVHNHLLRGHAARDDNG